MHIVSPAVVKSMCMFRSLYFFACCFPIIGLFFFLRVLGFLVVVGERKEVERENRKQAP